MAYLDSPNSHDERRLDADIIEAFDDFQSLQTLTASLIFRILHTRSSLEERLYAEHDLPAIDAFRLRHADECVYSPSLAVAIDARFDILTAYVDDHRVLIALEEIKDDTDTLIANFNHPSKTFFEANIDQSRLIARLTGLLPSLQPFLPAVSPEEPAWASTIHEGPRYNQEDIVSTTKEGLIRREEELVTLGWERDRVRVAEAASRYEHNNSLVGATCFDREPRSRPLVPSNPASAKRGFRYAAPMNL